jgi:hypothetical protein
MALTDKEVAALERLEAERARRISEKIEKGEAVRMKTLIVGARESIAAALARTLAALRAAGEKREVVSCDGVIITGVPRPGREPENYSPPISSAPQPTPSIFDRRSAGSAPPFAVSEAQPTAPKQIEPAESPVVHHVRATVRLPTENDPGAIVEGQYRIVNGNLEVTDLEGRLLGTQPINPGDDAEAAARAVLRKKRSSAFYDPIQYPRRSMP